MMSRLTLRSLLMALTLLIAATAAAQVRPSVLTSATPYGLQRGTTATFVVDGANLEGATEVLFSDAGLTATIDRYEDLGADIRERQPGETGAVIQDKARKGRLAITVTAAGTIQVGRHGFRVRTPLGTTSRPACSRTRSSAAATRARVSSCPSMPISSTKARIAGMARACAFLT